MCVSLLGACSASTPAVAHAPAGHPSASTAVVRTSPVIRNAVTVVPRTMIPFHVRTGPDGSDDVVIGDTRVTIGADAVRWATVTFTDAIMSATPVANGWVFVMSEGYLAFSETFLGAPRRLGNLSNAIGSIAPGVGRVAIVTDTGQLVGTDGSGPPAPMALPGDPTVLAAAFIDAQHGIVVLSGRPLLRTADGGSTWTDVDLGPAAAFDALAWNGRLVALTTAGARAIGNDGAVTATSPPPERLMGFEALTTPATLARLSLDMVTHHVREMVPQAIRRPDGTLLVQQDHRLLSIDPTMGSVVRSQADPLPEHCQLTTWGSAVGAKCFGAAPALYRSADGFAFERIDVYSAADAELSDDGRHALWAGACPGIEIPADVAAVPVTASQLYCALLDGHGERRTLAISGRDAQVLGFRGGRALVRSFPTEDDRGAVLTTVDLDSGRSRVVAIDPAGMSPQMGVLSARWLPDGQIAVVIAPEQTAAAGYRSPIVPGVRFAIGSPEATLATQEIGAGTVAASFADAMHGVAVGMDIAHIVRTLDGGRTWRPVRVPVDGLPERVELGNARANARPTIACDESGCDVAYRVRIDGWGEAPEGPPAAMAASAPAPPRATRPSEPENAAPTRFDCQLPTPRNAATTTSESESDSDPSARPDPRTVTIGGGANLATLSVHVDGARLAISANWQGEDLRGAFRAASPIASLELPHPDAETAEQQSSYALRGATRSALLFERCTVAEGHEPRCHVLWASAGGGIREVSDILAFRAAFDSNEQAEVGLVAPLADGGMLVQWFITSPFSGRERYVRIDPSGQVIAQRSAVFINQSSARSASQLAPRSLIVAGNRVGYARPSDRHADRFGVTFLDGPERESEVAAPSTQAVPACRAPAANAVQIIASGDRRFSAELPDSWGVPRAVLESANGRVCLRSLEYWPRGDYESNPFRPLRVVAGPGGLRASAMIGGRATAVRCVPARR